MEDKISLGQSWINATYKELRDLYPALQSFKDEHSDFYSGCPSQLKYKDEIIKQTKDKIILLRRRIEFLENDMDICDYMNWENANWSTKG